MDPILNDDIDGLNVEDKMSKIYFMLSKRSILLIIIVFSLKFKNNTIDIVTPIRA